MNRFVAIELLPDRVDVVHVRGGRIADSKRLPIELPSDPSAWCKALRAASGTLKQAVADLGATKLRAVVLYRSPTQAVDLASMEMRSAHQAADAASLDCLGGLSYHMDNAVVATSVVGRDLAGEGRKTHVVVAADRIDVLTAIVDFVTSAGLRAEHIAPIDAVINAAMAQRALRRGLPLQAWLYIGQHSSFFVIAGEGRVHFGRGLSLGLETLARTLTRPIRVRGRDEPVELDLDTALTVIHQVGVPRGEQVVYEPLGLTGTQLRPLVQPVLQRYIVELRQSMRFALPDGDFRDLPLTLLGPGGRLPSFDELLEEELGVRPQRSDDGEAFDRTVPGGPKSELHDALANRSALRDLTILPPAVAGKRRAAELRRCMWAGTAVALLLVALDAVRLNKQVEQARIYADSLASQMEQDEALTSTRLKLTNASAALKSLEDAISRERSACVSFRAVMHELSKVTPESVRLINLTFSTREGQSQCALRGYAKRAMAARGGTPGDSELKQFIERLKMSPLVSGVTLLNVERAELGGDPAESFQASMDLISIPPDLKPAQVVTAEAEEQP